MLGLPRPLLLLTLGAVLWPLALAAPAGAQETLPVQEADGVKIRNVRGSVTITFTGTARRLYRRLVAGRKTTVRCVTLPEPKLGLEGTRSRSETFVAPPRGRSLRTGISYRGQDYCRVLRARRVIERRRSRVVRPESSLVVVPLTQRGAVFLDEAGRAGQLLALLTAAGTLADDRQQRTYPSADEIEDRSDGEVVALDSPEATPPRDKLGYFSGDGRRVAVATLSGLGRRLFIEYDADTDTIRANVIQYLTDDID